MKYFRKHPDLLMLSNDPSAKRIIRGIKKRLYGKKIVFLSDTVRDCIAELLYHNQTDAVCVLFHMRIVGLLQTILILPLILAVLRATGKRVVLVFLTKPRCKPYPTFPHAVQYFYSVWFRWIISHIATATVSVHPKTETGKLVADELFPSPTRNLGLIALRERDYSVR